MKDNLKEILSELQSRLKPERFNHSLGVAYMAYSLSLRYGCDADKAFLTGLLHDCGKAVSNDNLISECEKYNIELTESEINNPGNLIHSKLGACMAEHLYGIKDAQILSAISYHTTGKPDMTLLEKIIYLSDCIEPGRRDYGNRAPNLTQIRQMAFSDLDTALYYTLKRTIDYLTGTNTDVDTNTLNAYEWYSKRIHI